MPPSSSEEDEEDDDDEDDQVWSACISDQPFNSLGLLSFGETSRKEWRD